MNPQTARNGLTFIQRGAKYIPMTAEEALAFADFVRALEADANADASGNDDTGR
jgi:hypothetical protein